MPDLSTITPVTREEEFLDRIARAAASPNLPEVDTSDNGDVLTVVSGEWAAAAPAGDLPEVTSSNNGQVLTVVSGEWAPAAPAAAIYLYETTDVPDIEGLPASPAGLTWSVNALATPYYVSLSPNNGTALTYGEIKDVFNQYINGVPVFFVTITDNVEFKYNAVQSGSLTEFTEDEEGEASLGLLSGDNNDNCYYSYTYTDK